ncbi:unnamed protein product, partial [Coregonus sp. 'balchen']
SAVKNLSAFRLLQGSFQWLEDCVFCSQILKHHQDRPQDQSAVEVGKRSLTTSMLRVVAALPYTPSETQLDLDEVLQAVIESTAYTNSATLQLCSKPAAMLLELVKAIITQEEAPKWECQPTRKQVCDLICILLLLNLPAKEYTHFLLLLLEYSPDGASLEQRQVIQNELLEFLMEMATQMEDVVFSSQKFLQKLFSGMFLVEPENLLTFLADQIVLVGNTLNAMCWRKAYHREINTNPGLLYFLSRQRHTQAEQEAVFRTLRVVMARWDVVMVNYKARVYAVGYCLCPTATQKALGVKRTRNTSREPCLIFSLSRVAALPQSDRELMSLDESVWSKILTERRPILEDTYKCELSANQI